MTYQAFMKMNETWEVWNIKKNKLVIEADTKEQAIQIVHALHLRYSPSAVPRAQGQ